MKSLLLLSTGAGVSYAAQATRPQIIITTMRIAMIFFIVHIPPEKYEIVLAHEDRVPLLARACQIHFNAERGAVTNEVTRHFFNTDMLTGLWFSREAPRNLSLPVAGRPVLPNYVITAN